MADIKVLYINADGLPQEHSESGDSIKMLSLKTANWELTDTKLGNLIDGGDAGATEHHHDSLYYRESEHVNSSAGAGDAGKPIVLDAGGKIDASMLDDADVDHGNLTGLGDDDHTQYTLADGTRAFTGDQSMGSNKITNLADGTGNNDAVNLGQLNAVVGGIDWKASVRFATTAALPTFTGGGTGTLTLTSQTAWSPDGSAVVNGDRVLVKDEGASDVDHGIYDVSGVGSEIILTRSSDADADSEVTSQLTTAVEEGSANAGAIFKISTADPITVNTTAIAFLKLDVSTKTASLGVELVGNDFRADLLASGGLKLTGNEIGVEPADFAGAGLVDDGADNMAIDWSTAFNDAKAVKAEDLNSVTNGEGASIIGIEDAGGYTSVTNVEAAIQELYANIAANGISYAAGTGGVTKGDLVYISAADTVLPYGTLTNVHRGIGLAATTESAAAQVVVLANDTKLTGLTLGGSPSVGDPIYWDGSGLTAVLPSGAGSHVWQAGVMSAAGELHVQVEFIKKNA